MMYLIWFGIFIFCFSTGLIGQLILQRIVPANVHEKVKLSSFILWLFSIWFWRFKIKNSGSVKMKVYKEEMKKPLVPYTNYIDCYDSSFLNTLIEEPNLGKIEKILNVVLQTQEQVRKKQNGESGFSFIKQKFINHGPGNGLSMVAFPLFYVFYRKHLKGEFVPNARLEIALRCFGSREEQIALKFENDLRMDQVFKKARWIEHKVKEYNLLNNAKIKAKLSKETVK